MVQIIDKVGLVFDRWTIINLDPKTKGSKWICQCACGTIKSVKFSTLKLGKSRSCGCLRANKPRRHGHAINSNTSPTYHSWRGMIQRCTNPNSISYKNYGARGISVCERWLKFENFLEDMGERPSGLTLERKNNDKNYNQDNCEWITWKEQQNHRRNTKLYSYNSITKTIGQWADELHIHRRLMDKRIKTHPWWSFKDVILDIKRKYKLNL